MVQSSEEDENKVIYNYHSQLISCVQDNDCNDNSSRKRDKKETEKEDEEHHKYQLETRKPIKKTIYKGAPYSGNSIPLIVV